MLEDNDPITIGAIRLGAWFANEVNPYEKNLADKKWRGRLPFYAWNEADEGGWLVPDLGSGSAKLDAIRGVVEAAGGAR